MSTPPTIEIDRYFIEMGIRDAKSGSGVSLQMPSGDLFDKFGFFRNNNYNPYLKSASDVFSLPGAILVAEGGMGKTYVMNYFADKIPEHSRIKIALGEYCGNSPDLSSKLRNISDEIEYIFIDGVDEARDVIPTLLRMLISIDRGRIHVFVALRNIEQLKVLQERVSLPVYLLLPLSKEGVISIAEHENANGEEFVANVIQEELAPICANPQGCKALLNGYKNGGLKNISREALWTRSVLSLCAENDSGTRPIGCDAVPCITPEECFDHAVKIALILKLAGHNVVGCLKSTLSADDKNALPLSDFYGSSDADKINMILSRGIFMPAGSARFKFAHFSYLDYFAAIGLLKIVNRKYWPSILLVPDKTSVYPSWEGAASWLAAYDQDWRGIILEIHPELLLASDCAIDMIGTAQLCRAIIKRADKLTLEQRYDVFFIKRLARLKSDEIIPVLEEALDTPSSLEQMEMAIDIIRECKIHEFERKLVNIFCDSTFDHEIRKHAGYSLCEYASVESRVMCKAVLCAAPCPLDLVGILLKMTWPKLMDINEFAPYLTEPASGIIDDYYYWIVYDFPNTLLDLGAKRAKEALEWAIADVVETDGYCDFLLNMRRQIFTLCWKNFTSPDFMPLLARGMLAFIKIHSSPFADESIHCTPPTLCYTNKEFYADIQKRHQLAQALIELPMTSGEDLTIFSVRTLLDTDVDFVFSMIESCGDSTLCKKWCVCLRVLQRNIPLPEMSQRWNDVHRQFPDVITCDALTAMRERKKWDDECAKRRAEFNSRDEARKLKKHKCRSDNMRFIKSVLGSSNTYEYFPWMIDFFIEETNLDTIDFRSSNIWKEFSPLEIKQIAWAARDFLTKGNPASLTRTGGVVYPFVPIAFFMIETEIDEGLTCLPKDAWQKFSVFLFDFVDIHDEGVLGSVFRGMSRLVPDIFNAAMLEKIKNDIAGGITHTNIKYCNLFNDDLCSEIVRFAISDKCSNLQRYWLLKSIHKSSPKIVKDFMLQNNVLAQEGITCWGNCASVLVLNIFPDKIHDFIQQLVTSTPEYGRRWLEDSIKVNSLNDNGLISVFEAADIEDLTAFYIWLNQNYPPSEAPVHNDVYTSSAIDEIYSFIRDIFSAIKQCQSTYTLDALQKIYDTFPEHVWLKDVILEVKRTNFKKCTPTYGPNEIKRIIDSNESGVIINSPEDLLRLVVDLLTDYQNYLRGKESPRADDLWNINSKDDVSHKDEEYFSDHLRSFLSIRLKGAAIAINREVQLHTGINGESGARTDIWINAFSNPHNKNIRLCIEVKGSWNPDTLTAMNTQLIEKYMGVGGADAGILLVGWFTSKNCPVKNICNNDINTVKNELKRQEHLANAAGNLVQGIVVNCPAKY